VSLICICDTSTWIASGMSVGSASMFSSRVICSSTPPSFTPGASSVPRNSTPTTAEIACLRSTRRKSTCSVSLRTGWTCVSLSTAGVASPPPTDSSITAPRAASAWRSARSSTANGIGSSPPP
jgi:hypothetical protein